MDGNGVDAASAPTSARVNCEQKNQYFMKYSLLIHLVIDTCGDVEV